jgi:hypothetical protein
MRCQNRQVTATQQPQPREVCVGPVAPLLKQKVDGMAAYTAAAARLCAPPHPRGALYSMPARREKLTPPAASLICH